MNFPPDYFMTLNWTKVKNTVPINPPISSKYHENPNFVPCGFIFLLVAHTIDDTSANKDPRATKAVITFGFTENNSRVMARVNRPRDIPVRILSV